MYTAQMTVHSEKTCCPLPSYFLTTNWNYTVYTEWKQTQWDKSLISQCRQGKLVPGIAVTSNETSEGFPVSSSDPRPMRPYREVNCTRPGCSLFSCMLVWRLLQHPQARLHTGMTGTARAETSAECSHPTHMAISSLGSWPTTVALQQWWVLRSGAAIGMNNVSQYLISQQLITLLFCLAFVCFEHKPQTDINSATNQCKSIIKTQ